MLQKCLTTTNDIINYVESISTDSVLVGANLFGWLENYNKFSNIRNALQKYKVITGYSCTDYSVVLNKKQLSIHLGKTTVKIKKFTKEEINQAIKGGRYFVLITNDIELPYTKEQAEEYVYKKYRYVTVDVELDIEYIGENVGSLALRKSVCEGVK